MSKQRNAAGTRGKIVRAAAAEFSAKGYAGARMQGIADRAGVKKELLYHYFRSKEHLFGEIRGSTINAGLRRDPVMPDGSTDILAARFARVVADIKWVRLITWEAAQGGDKDLPREDERRKTIAQYVKALRSAQRKGKVTADYDARFLQLAIFALTTYPLAFAQITRLTTGRPATDPKFQQEWGRFLGAVGKRMLRVDGRSKSASPQRK